MECGLEMKQQLCDVPVPAVVPDDKSGVGVHYVDGYLKPMNTKLEDGTAGEGKRRGLKVTLTVGAKKGDGLMRRGSTSSPDPAVMLDAALQEAAQGRGWSS